MSYLPLKFFIYLSKTSGIPTIPLSNPTGNSKTDTVDLLTITIVDSKPYCLISKPQVNSCFYKLL